jgi:hypothetical protein
MADKHEYSVGVAVPETVRSEEAPSRSSDWHERAHWNPSPEQFAAYLAREVEMAAVNMRRGVRGIDTLHSFMTVSAVLANPENNLDPERAR